MPKRTDISKILIIGSGPIVIGQACEFDYSGTQACKALREEGYQIVLVNSNPATIMTDPGLADRTYVEPLTKDFVEAIIKRERPDALLPTVGGQTALNIAVELAEAGVLDTYGVEMIGAKAKAVKMAEDRLLFKEAMKEIGLETPRSEVVGSMVLFVDEAESVARQLKRGRETLAHNEKVARSGIGQLREDRPTDHDETLARRRYEAFKEQTWDALQSLKEIFHYHFINAQGPLETVEQNILKELRYQSTLELDPITFDKLRSIPVASSILVHARQELVKRMDSYAFEHGDLLAKVIGFIEKKTMPIILRHAISGVAHINTEDPVLDDPLALAMLIDVFSERGYHAAVDIHRVDVPERVDLTTGLIESRVKKVYRIRIRFQGSEIRWG